MLPHRFHLALVVTLLSLGAGSALATPPPAPLLEAPRFEVTGRWNYGALKGHGDGKATIWSSDRNAGGTWYPNVGSICPVRVSFYIASNPSNTTNAVAEVTAGGKTTVVPLNLMAEPARWVDLGTYAFAGRNQESIRVAKKGSGALRLSALRLDILDPKDNRQVWQTVILDDLTAYDPKSINPEKTSFTDLPPNHPLSEIASSLADGGIMPGESQSTFGPNQEMRAIAFTAAIARLLNRPSTEKLDQSAAAGLALRQGWMTGGSQGSSLTIKEALTLMVRAARCGIRPLAWLKAPANPDDIPAWAQAMGIYQGLSDPVLTGGSILTRGKAAVLLDHFARNLIHAGPLGTAWELTFADEFNGDHIDTNVWTVTKNETWGGLQSVRVAENVIVKDGQLQLMVRKEARNGKEWTTAFVDTGTVFRQKYGYWEARYRYAQAPGLNNAFWLHSGKSTPKEQTFEIDINEGHWPNVLNMTLHQNELQSLSKRWHAPVDLGLDWHVYAVDWNEKEIIYYWDGREVGRNPNTNAHLNSAVIFSTAVFPWAGPITDRLDGTSMDVDWVRVWRRRPAQP